MVKFRIICLAPKSYNEWNDTYRIKKHKLRLYLHWEINSGDIAVKGSATLTWNIALSEGYQLLATPDTAGGAKYITEIGYINGTGANIYVSYATSGSAGNRLIHWMCTGKR